MEVMLHHIQTVSHCVVYWPLYFIYHVKLKYFFEVGGAIIVAISIIISALGGLIFMVSSTHEYLFLDKN